MFQEIDIIKIHIVDTQIDVSERVRRMFREIDISKLLIVETSNEERSLRIKRRLYETSFCRRSITDRCIFLLVLTLFEC